MTHLISAIQFLTILPVRTSGTFQPNKMVPFFPLVGLILGFFLCIFDALAMMFWPSPVVAVLDIVFLALMTGSLHLDGLSDTADGLYGNRPVETALTIMKDSRVGAMGLVAVVLGLAVKWGGISALGPERSLCLFLVPGFARAGTLFGLKYLPYGRPEGGTGHAFFEEPPDAGDFWGVLLLVGLSLLLGIKGIMVTGCFFIMVWLTLRFYKKRVGCITGDMLGAMIEVMEAVLFLICAM